MNKPLDLEVQQELAAAVSTRKAELLKGDYWDLDIKLEGICNSAPSEPSVGYQGWTEVTVITFAGKQFDAREFPREFVRAIEERLRS